MPFPFSSANTASKPFFIISFLLILSHGFITVTKAQNESNGADPFRTACAEWEIPTQEKPMKIAVPCHAVFEKFVMVNLNETSEEKKYYGFCIDIFRNVLKVLLLEKNYTLPCEFVPYNGSSYNELVEGVANGTFHAAIGDITILANRSKLVEFTQPYVESRLVMIAPAKSQVKKAWKFLKPFTMEMWIATGAILIYTMFIVWLLEHPTNPEFRGPWKNQLGTALWFTFSSLFFSHRERVYSNFTRVVVVVWLFVVLILNSSYTANLSSMLTVSQLKPKVTSIEWLKRTNSRVGCNAGSFVLQFLTSEYGFEPANIMKASNENDYVKEFESGNISAVFLELPYGKHFMSQYGNLEGYTMTEPKYKRFGGFGFVFQKCSPIATNVSEAILTLLENGELQMLENEWFGKSFEESDLDAANNSDHESLSLQSFWGLYLITFATSTMLVLIHLLKNYRLRIANFSESLSFQSFWDLYLVTNATSAILLLIDLLRNYRRRLEEYTSPSNTTPRHLQASPSFDVEIV